MTRWMPAISAPAIASPLFTRSRRRGSPAALNDDLRYGSEPAQATQPSGELAFPENPLQAAGLAETKQAHHHAGDGGAMRWLRLRRRARISASPSRSRPFGQKLRGTDAVSAYPYGSILDLASGARGGDAYGYTGGIPQPGASRQKPQRRVRHPVWMVANALRSNGGRLAISRWPSCIHAFG